MAYNAVMGMIRIYTGKSKPANKKPGWQQREAEYQAWLTGVQNQKLGLSHTTKKGKVKAKDLVVPASPVVLEDRLYRHPSLNTFGGSGTKPVARPNIMYKDDPEMLARELAARQVKHNTAPAYNKGPVIFVTEEEITKTLVGGRRR